MQEIKPPKKSLTFYYVLVLAIILLFNDMARPYFTQQQIEQVDYGTFMTMIDDQKIDKVEIKDNQILFIGKDDNSAGLQINADGSVVLKGTSFTIQPVTNAAQINVNGKPVDGHTHGGIDRGSSNTDPL